MEPKPSCAWRRRLPLLNGCPGALLGSDGRALPVGGCRLRSAIANSPWQGSLSARLFAEAADASDATSHSFVAQAARRVGAAVVRIEYGATKCVPVRPSTLPCSIRC